MPDITFKKKYEVFRIPETKVFPLPQDELVGAEI